MADDETPPVHDAIRRATDAYCARESAEILRPLFADIGWLDGLIATQIGQMQADHLCLPAFSATRSGALSHLTLAASPKVTIAISRIGGAAERPAEQPSDVAERVCFSGQQSLWRSLSASPLNGRLARLSQDGATCRDRAIVLRPGAICGLDERRVTLWIAPPERPAWLLRARIRRDPAPVMRHFTLNSGTVASRVQGDDRLARSVMMLGILRAIGDDSDAGFDAGLALLDRAEGLDRWTVMRELIALNPARAHTPLHAMANDNANAPDVLYAARSVLDRMDALSVPARSIRRKG